MTMQPRWWRVGVLLEREGVPWTWTFHVRARREEGVRRLIAERLGGEPHGLYALRPSEPLPRVDPAERIVAEAGPFQRSWSEPEVAALRSFLSADDRSSGSG